MFHNIILWKHETGWTLCAEIWSTTQLFYKSPVQIELNDEQAKQLIVEYNMTQDGSNTWM